MGIAGGIGPGTGETWTGGGGGIGCQPGTGAIGTGPEGADGGTGIWGGGACGTWGGRAGTSVGGAGCGVTGAGTGGGGVGGLALEGGCAPTTIMPTGPVPAPSGGSSSPPDGWTTAINEAAPAGSDVSPVCRWGSRTAVRVRTAAPPATARVFGIISRNACPTAAPTVSIVMAQSTMLAQISVASSEA
jgi:hypothetical protein